MQGEEFAAHRYSTRLLISFRLPIDPTLSIISAGGTLHAIIIGAGVIGASIAYYLSAAGARVTVIERGRPGGGTSGTSTAYVNAVLKRPEHYHRFSRLGVSKHTINWKKSWGPTAESGPGERSTGPGRCPVACALSTAPLPSWKSGITPMKSFPLTKPPRLSPTSESKTTPAPSSISPTSVGWKARPSPVPYVTGPSIWVPGSWTHAPSSR